MKSANEKNVLISGASIAGLSTAYWLHQLGYRVTIVELAAHPRVGGAAINIQGDALTSAKRMGIYEHLKAHRLQLERLEFKNADDVTEGQLLLQSEEPDDEPTEIEIERDKLVPALVAALHDEVEFLFSNRITGLSELADAVRVTFRQGPPRTFDLVIGCDGAHSGVRKLWFDNEPEYVHFLDYYFSLSIVNSLLIPQGTAQLYNVPDQGIMLNAYKGKTDIVFWFFSEQEISYDYRNAAQQRQLVEEQFTGQGWRTTELLAQAQQANILYFDKFCQVRMPSWTKGRVALVGDAGYCASPAAGMGATLAMSGAAAVAEALATHGDNYAAAFEAYNQGLRPVIEQVQATARTMLSTYFVPKTEEAIRIRNMEGISF
jgi:2-polyprenyl-6-methoxyphenol hydroxylase-like FAD-dependent oxidoreductase